MDKAKKKRIKKYISWGCIAALVLLLAVMPLMAKSEVEAEGPVASVLSGTVEKGSVSTSLHGGGNLTTDNAEDVKLPSGVKITEFLVKNGDVVTEGTPLASVDKVSVMTAIVEVTETMEYLQEQIESVREETVSSYVYATAGGYVKEIYAEEGDSVQDVMLEHGCLAVLSLDGLLAVKMERGMDVSTGDSVYVTLSDDTEVTGRVESNLDGVIIVTIEDEGYPVGDQVIVTTEDGHKVGIGELYIHNAWKATAFTGTISAVRARENTEVSSGSTLFTLTDTGFTAELEYLSDQHREYEALMQDLFKMYESGTINAPCDGLVSGVDKDSAHLLSSEEAQWEAELLTAETKSEATGWKIVLLSNVAACTGDENCQLPADSDQHLDGCIGACDKSVTCDADVHHLSCIQSCDHADGAEGCDATGSHYADCIKGCANSKTQGQCKSQKHYLTCIESCISSDGTRDCPASGTHKKSCIEACSHADKTGVCEASKHHYTDCIESCVSSSGAGTECSAGKHKDGCYFKDMVYTAMAAKVYDVGLELVINADISGTVYDVERTATGWKLANDAKLNTDLLVQEETSLAVADPKNFSPGDVILVVTGYKNGEAAWSDVVIYQKGESSGDGGSEQRPSGSGSGSMGSLSGLAGMLSGMSGLMGSYGGTTGTAAEQELFDLEGSVLMTVTPQDTVSLTITLDEKDISKVSAGQSAEVKVEALRGQLFEAEVVEVSTSGTNSGGSSKFTVKLEMPYGENMLDGMSATASIPLYTKLDVLTIPVKALVEDGARTVVYTALDPETGDPASPVEVTTGMSDGITAELVSGLQLGDTYYYSYYDILELDTTAEANGFSFGG